MALTDNLISVWELDESSGDAVDSHGSNTLTDNGTVGTDTGKINGARSFLRANSEYFSIADNTSLSMGDIDFSVAAWVYLGELTNNQYIVSKYATTGNQREYALQLVGADDKFRWLVSAAGTSGVFVDWSSTSTTSTWYYVACGHSASGNVIWISVDAGTPVTAAHSTGCFNGTSDFNIGARPAAADLFTGRIDQVAVWKRDIRSDLATLYNSGSGLAYSSWGGGGGSTTPWYFMAQQMVVS